jgi:phenylpropionate dioxygenase-like ring-hydroxylating dioxygenase large terminal subunit
MTETKVESEYSDNEILVRTGPGTPMGNVFRSFWLPALLSAEIIEPDGAPVRLRILGEDLIAFRDTQGRVGILSAYCRHRLAPLFYGRNEHCGIRCVYHGWKFDIHGQCVDIPNVPKGKISEGVKERANITAYPACEAGGMVWVFMGPKERMPPLPGMEWMSVPDDHRHVARWLQRTNWAQGMEGELDTSHISFLHSGLNPEEMPAVIRWATDRAPVITLHDTDYGYVYGARRTFEDDFYWRVTHWLLPMWSAIAGPPEPFWGQGRAWVPVDDHHVMTFGYNYKVDRAFSAAEIADFESGLQFPPRRRKGVFELTDGYLMDAFLPVANRENDYFIDRVMQREKTFTGISGINEQDRALQESFPGLPGARRGIVDRSREMLVASDLPIVKARRRMVSLARAMEKGIWPSEPNAAERYAVRPISRLTKIGDFNEFLSTFGADMHASAWGPNGAKPAAAPAAPSTRSTPSGV